MALSELIKYEGANNAFIWKYPNEDFNFMTQLLVDESQEAIFYANGRIADVFGPGRYTLNSTNIPILTDMLNRITGVSRFSAKVYFVNRTIQMAMLWGVRDITIIEPINKVRLSIGLGGTMNLTAGDACQLVRTVNGTMSGIAWDGDNEEYAKSMQRAFLPMISDVIKRVLPSVILEKNIDVVEMDAYAPILADAIGQHLRPEMEKYGISMHEFYISSIRFPEYDPNYKVLVEMHDSMLVKNKTAVDVDLARNQIEADEAVMTAKLETAERLEAAKRGAVIENQITQTKVAEFEGQRKLMEAQVQANITRMQGSAEAAVMKEKNYDQKDVIDAEVKKEFAKGLGQFGANGGGAGGSVMGDMMSMGMGIAAMNTMVPQMSNAMQGFNMNQPAAPAQQEQIQCSCGATLPANAKFCLECGKKVEIPSADEVVCPSCGQKTPKGKFCINCGNPMVNRCPECGTELPSGARFCTNCGHRM